MGLTDSRRAGRLAGEARTRLVLFATASQKNLRRRPTPQGPGGASVATPRIAATVHCWTKAKFSLLRRAGMGGIIAASSPKTHRELEPGWHLRHSAAPCLRLLAKTTSHWGILLRLIFPLLRYFARSMREQGAEHGSPADTCNQRGQGLPWLVRR